MKNSSSGEVMKLNNFQFGSRYLFLCFTKSLCYVALADLELTDLPACLPSVGIIHPAWMNPLIFLFCFDFMPLKLGLT